MNPDITLCVLTYNRSKDIENIIKTYLWQSYQKSELVIIDDASPDNTASRVKKWLAKDKRIRYIQNKKNIGLSRNFAQAFRYCKGKYIVFLGDDDIFVSTSALEEYLKIFRKYKAGVVRSRQILFKNWKIFQAASFGDNEKEDIYKKGYDAFRSFVYETTSIAGLGFANTNILRKLALTLSTSMYPQVELAAKMLLFYDGVQINKYLIGVQSHEGQLNVVSYSLDGQKTNILDDLYTVFSRVRQVAKEKHMKIPSLDILMCGVVAFLPIFLPYNTLKNGKRSSFLFMKVMYTYDKRIVFRKLFLLSLGLVLLPRQITERILSIINATKLPMVLDKGQLRVYADELKKYQ